MKRDPFGGRVKEGVFGYPLMNQQSADETFDKNYRTQTKDGVFMTGRGSQGGGSKKTPQAQQMVTGNSRGGSYTIGSSIPKHPQKLRG